MLQTDQRWPAVTSQNEKLLVNADGSVDVYFGPKAPAGKENNWVQTLPERAGIHCCGSMAHYSHGSTRRGVRERLNLKSNLCDDGC